MKKEVYLVDMKWIETHDKMGGVIATIVFKENLSIKESEMLMENKKIILEILGDK